jgi:hypothetical protein
MPLTPENHTQILSRDRTDSSGTLETPIPTLSLHGTPGSQASIDRQADYGFWDVDQQSKDDGSLTPITPFRFSPGDHIDHTTETHLSTPLPTHLRKSKSDPQLSYPFHASESESGQKDVCARVKVEEDDLKPGWLSKLHLHRQHDSEHHEDPQSHKRVSSAKPSRSTGPDIWRTGTEERRPEYFVLSEDYELDFDFSRASIPSRKTDTKVPNVAATIVGTEKHTQSFYNRVRKNGNTQYDIDNPIPSRSRDSHPHKAETKQLVTNSGFGLATQSKSSLVDSGLGQVQQQSCSLKLKDIYRQTNKANRRINKSEFSECRTRTIASSNTFAKILPLNTRERLMEKPGICVGSKTRKLDQRCSKKANGPPEAVTRHLDSMSDLDLWSDPGKILEYINGLIDLTLCKGWHREIATDELEKWLRNAGKPLRNTGYSKTGGDRPAAEFAAFIIWIEALTGAALFAPRVQAEPIYRAAFSDQGKAQSPFKTENSSNLRFISIINALQLTSL